MKIDNALPPPELREIYPESDGRKSGEHSETYRWVRTLLANFQMMFHEDPDVLVAARMLWYPSEGRPDIRHAPHAMIAFGRPQGDRTAYLQWIEEGVAPQVAFEIRPRMETEGQEPSVFEFYERYGVEEYYRYDWMFGELLGWRRSAEGTLVRIPEMNGWTSPRLQLRFEMCDRQLRLIQRNGQGLLSLVEMLAERDREREEVECLKREIESIRAECRQIEVESDQIRAEIRRLNALEDDRRT